MIPNFQSHANVGIEQVKLIYLWHGAAAERILIDVAMAWRGSGCPEQRVRAGTLPDI